MDWIHAQRIPREIGRTFEVWLRNGRVRTCALNPDLDWFTLFFTDCIDPFQNVVLHDDAVMAWRFH